MKWNYADPRKIATTEAQAWWWGVVFGFGVAQPLIYLLIYAANTCQS